MNRLLSSGNACMKAGYKERGDNSKGEFWRRLAFILGGWVVVGKLVRAIWNCLTFAMF